MFDVFATNLIIDCAELLFFPKFSILLLFG